MATTKVQEKEVKITEKELAILKAQIEEEIRAKLEEEMKEQRAQEQRRKNLTLFFKTMPVAKQESDERTLIETSIWGYWSNTPIKDLLSECSIGSETQRKNWLVGNYKTFEILSQLGLLNGAPQEDR